MKNDFGKYTREIVSDIPFDSNDPEYQKCKEKVPQFTGQAIYVYSFVKNRMLYAHGWDEMLGYKDEEITLLKLIVNVGSLNTQALQISFVRWKTHLRLIWTGFGAGGSMEQTPLILPLRK